MKKRLFHFLLSLTLLASSLPSLGMACGQGCRMSPAKMLGCLRSCNLAKHPGRMEIGKADCVKLNLGQAQSLVSQDFSFKLDLPSGGVMPAAQAPSIKPAATAFLGLLRGPPSLPTQVSLSTPSQNAPPAF